MKKVLIISPYFVPSNAPDMHRTRMSLPYYSNYGWEAELVCVHDKYSEFNKDELLWESVPKSIKIHYVNALPKKVTSKLGLGSLALRSLWSYRQKVNQLLKNKKYDLIYFSTTQFPICILGTYWKKKFNIPYVIDMQDPWHTEYYQNKPKHERPPKYWFSYRLNKYLEPMAMNKVGGLISVSETYLKDLEHRYNHIKNTPKKVITFGYSDIDLEISKNVIKPSSAKKTLTYIGVLGAMMHKSLEILFKGLSALPEFQKDYQLVFKGTSYANKNQAVKTAETIAQQYNIKNITEDTNRIGMFEVLSELSSSTGLLIIGTDDEGYTASKLYPYLQVGKPILAILHPNSSAFSILKNTSNATVILLSDPEKLAEEKLVNYFNILENKNYTVYTEKLKEYSSTNLTKEQCTLFNQVISLVS